MLLVAEKLSTEVSKKWGSVKERARSVAKIRPVKVSGPLLAHRLILKENFSASMEIISCLLLFTGIYQKCFLVSKTRFWAEPQRELRCSELSPANIRD